MSWDDFEKEIEKLATKITSSFDVIVPIARGGLIPGRILATKLHIKTMYVLTVEKSGEKRQVVTQINKNVTNQKILLVEDMLETGNSMTSAKEYLETKGANVLTGCLYTMEDSKITPDFYLAKVSKVVSFPWE